MDFFLDCSSLLTGDGYLLRAGGVKEAGEVCGGGGVGVGVQIGATFLFFFFLFNMRSTQISMTTQKNIGTHDFCTHRKRIYSTGTH